MPCPLLTQFSQLDLGSPTPTERQHEMEVDDFICGSPSSSLSCEPKPEEAAKQFLLTEGQGEVEELISLIQSGEACID